MSRWAPLDWVRILFIEAPERHRQGELAFTFEEVEAAANWHSCAVGEAAKRLEQPQPANRFEYNPLTQEEVFLSPDRLAGKLTNPFEVKLDTAGVAFYQSVRDQDLKGARRVYRRIQRYTAKLDELLVAARERAGNVDA